MKAIKARVFMVCGRHQKNKLQNSFPNIPISQPVTSTRPLALADEYCVHTINKTC